MGTYITVNAEDEYGDTIEATVYSDDILDEIADYEMVGYLERNGYSVMDGKEFDALIGRYDAYCLPKGFNKQDAYEFFCDVFEVSYHTPKEEILKRINEMF